jgi:hypothetical protein
MVIATGQLVIATVDMVVMVVMVDMVVQVTEATTTKINMIMTTMTTRMELDHTADMEVKESHMEMIVTVKFADMAVNHMEITMIAMVRKAMDMVAKAMVEETIMVAITIMIIHMAQVVMDKEEKVMEVTDQDMDMAVKENHMEAQMAIIVMVRKDMVPITMEMDIPRKDMVMEITMDMACHMAIAMEDHHIKFFLFFYLFC